MNYQEAMDRHRTLRIDNARDQAIAEKVREHMASAVIGILQADCDYGIPMKVTVETLRTEFTHVMTQACEGSPAPRGAMPEPVNLPDFMKDHPAGPYEIRDDGHTYNKQTGERVD